MFHNIYFKPHPIEQCPALFSLSYYVENTLEVNSFVEQFSR
jgi:hypothetical protein